MLREDAQRFWGERGEHKIKVSPNLHTFGIVFSASFQHCKIQYCGKCEEEGGSKVNGRHEVKHYISLTDYWVLRSRLETVLERDPHAGKDGAYQIRSVYYDSPDDRALREKLDGVKNRDKYRIRYYNFDTEFIQLEKKSKRGNLCIKSSAILQKEQVQDLLNGQTDWMRESRSELIKELYRKMFEEGLRPTTIVDYIRDPFIFTAGNVRVTLDHDIRTGLRTTCFLDPDCVTIPVANAPIILEVKWDEYLPDIVRDAVQVPGRSATAFSKYAACRIYDF